MNKILFAALFAAASFSHASVITFDSGYQTVVAQNNLVLNNFNPLNTVGYGSSGYVNGLISGTYVGFTYNNSGSITSTAAFTFNSAYLTSAWNNGEIVDIVASLNGSTAFTRSLTLNVTAPTLVTFDWTGIDKVTFNVHGGTSAGLGGGGSFLAFDNIRVNEAVASAVPEPSSVALLGLGLLGFVAGRRRKGARQSAR